MRSCSAYAGVILGQMNGFFDVVSKDDHHGTIIAPSLHQHDGITVPSLYQHCTIAVQVSKDVMSDGFCISNKESNAPFNEWDGAVMVQHDGTTTAP